MLKTYQGNVRDLELDFTTVQASFGESKVVELKPNGASIPVTNATRVEYVNLVANYKLNRQVRGLFSLTTVLLVNLCTSKWLPQ